MGLDGDVQADGAHAVDTPGAAYPYRDKFERQLKPRTASNAGIPIAPYHDARSQRRRS